MYQLLTLLHLQNSYFMDFKFFVGIDVSIETLDFSLAAKGEIFANICVQNSSKGIKAALKEFKKPPTTLSTVRYEGEFKSYCQRKIEEGKHKMVVLNALKNKIIHRVFAVVKRGSKYDKNFSYAA